MSHTKRNRDVLQQKSCEAYFWQKQGVTDIGEKQFVDWTGETFNLIDEKKQ